VHDLILWAGFLGAWLLVAGPVWQAVVELGNEEFERERFTSAVDSVPPPQRVSSWWWLLPPLRLYLSSRSNTRFQHQVLLSLPDEDYDAFSSFMAKARGWMLVGLGGLLILSKETWDLVEGREWDTWVFWALFLGMALLAAANAAYQSARQVRTTARRASARAAQQGSVS
jgi:hypothetical protein